MESLSRFARNRGAVAGAVIILLIIALAAFADLLFPRDALRIVGPPELWPLEDNRFVLGTDSLGRDIAAMIAHGARASLLITQPDSSGDPLGASRVTLLGTAAEVPAPEVRDLYLSRYENAKYWQEYSDFGYQRLEVSSIYFIGGFGVMGWVEAAEYAQARPDPLAEVTQEIIGHMNADHADALLLIARRFAGEAATEASMTAVDRLGFHLRLKSGDRVHGRRLAFLREVGSKDEARQVLVEMVREARSSETQ